MKTMTCKCVAFTDSDLLTGERKRERRMAAVLAVAGTCDSCVFSDLCIWKTSSHCRND